VPSDVPPGLFADQFLYRGVSPDIFVIGDGIMSFGKHWVLIGCLGLAAACATNPVTGKKELVLVSEAQEIEIGLANAQQVDQEMGLVDDPELAQYVSDIGMRLARASERPDLPWQFNVVDSPVVNAFALPGGPVYLTRGILAHMNSEAAMVGVLGHEIGHVERAAAVAVGVGPEEDDVAEADGRAGRRQDEGELRRPLLA